MKMTIFQSGINRERITLNKKPCLLYLFRHCSVDLNPITGLFHFIFSFPRFYNNYNKYPHHIHLSALIPFGIMFVISTIIFIMIIFRRWPGLVSGIIAGLLTFVSIYILLLTLKEEVLVYE